MVNLGIPTGMFIDDLCSKGVSRHRQTRQLHIVQFEVYQFFTPLIHIVRTKISKKQPSNMDLLTVVGPDLYIQFIER